MEDSIVIYHAIMVNYIVSYNEILWIVLLKYSNV